MTKLDTSRADAYLRRVHALFDVQDAVRHLREARQLLRRAHAPRATLKVRRALKSAEGAVRHAQRMRNEVE